MPRVGIKGWKGLAPTTIPDALVEVLLEVTDMERAEVVAALRSEALIEAYFDLGEDEAAGECVNKLKSFGLFCHLYPEGKSPYEKERERERRKTIAIWVVLIGSIPVSLVLAEPWFGVLLLAIVVTGVAFAFFIRRAG
jgi:hypothetical protein